MKATGVVRRIDELGRIVIPKEIRKTLRIKENDNMDIYIDSNNNIILQKFSLINNIAEVAQEFVESIHSFLKHNVLITDKSNIIAYAGSDKKEYINEPISEQLEFSIARRENILEKYDKEYQIIKNKTEKGSHIISSIIASGDVVGLIIVLAKEKSVDETDEKVIKIVSQFLGKYIEQ